MKLYMFLTVPLSIIRGFLTIYTAVVYVRMELQFHPDPAAAPKLSTNLHDICHCSVYSE
jgi:hypothetical protein